MVEEHLKTKLLKLRMRLVPAVRLAPATDWFGCYLSTDNNGALNSKSVGKFSGSKSKSRQKTDSKSTVNSSCSNVKLKQKVGADEVKENRNGQPGSVRHTAKEYNVVVNNGDMLPKKRQSKSRKKKELVGGVDDGEASMKKSEPSVGSSVSGSLFIDFLEDDEYDEENLEQNAARMLSSRFDPSCTGFSAKKKIFSISDC
ncbi:UNVERIFIED_CONTAM: hypothetical protein Sradi_5016200 [Sesamum radiatum]|uniref:Uncharacterized protein n=1 Tax=Sesamum radiatum TaxID=300843 RepID=A0AAW2MI14_SESRA